MPQDLLVERVSDALSRAQTFTFTVFSAALIIAFVTFTHVAARQAEYDRLTTEKAHLTHISNLSENAIRAVRNYILSRCPEATSEEEAIHRILEAVSNVHDRSNAIRALLTSRQLDLPIASIAQINRLLSALDAYGDPIASMYVHYFPQSVVPADHLELLRLSDLVVLAYFVGADPIGVSERLAAFVDLPSREAAEQLLDSLQLIANDERSELRDSKRNGEQLLQIIDRPNGAQLLAPGGLWSSHAATLDGIREIEDRESILTHSVGGDFQIRVPIIDLEMPSRFVVVLFPVGLIIGFGLVAEALNYSYRQLQTEKDTKLRAKIADVGVLFTQLRQSGHWAALLTWVPLLGLLLLPQLAALLVVGINIAYLSLYLIIVVWVTMSLSALLALLVFRYAWLLSSAVSRPYLPSC